MPRRDNGEGTIFKRKDGRWCAKVHITLPNGAIKRVAIVKKDRSLVKAQLDEWKERNRKHLPLVEENWTVESYITHWLNDVMPDKIRLSTMIRYKGTASKYIIPNIGRIPLKELSVRHVQGAIDDLSRRGIGGNAIQKFQRVLSSCLTRAMREEIVFRNVAQLVELPKYSKKEIIPWTADQAKLFLGETKDHHFHIAYAMMLTYGIRKGEMHGLRWTDIDFKNDKIYIRQQLGRLAGALRVGEVKTKAGRRTLPLIPEIKQKLLEKAAQMNFEIPHFDPIGNLSTDNLILKSFNDTAMDQRNLSRSFHLHVDKIGLPRITMHTMRHTAATLLKNLNVPVKDVQLILGHSDIATTLAIYQHGDENAHRTALKAIGAALNT